MKNAKRMMAVIAASGLALGSMPGIANAQGSAELGVNLGAALGSGDLALDLAVDLGSEASDLPTVDELPPSSLGELTEPGGSLDPDTGSLAELTEPGGSLDPDTGSLAELTEPGGSLTTLTGSLTELTEPGGSLDPDTGLLNTFVAGSVEAFEAGSSNLGSNGTDTDIFLGSDAAGLATIGSLAVAGIGIGLAVSGGVNLPPLPEINVGLVCNLPPEAIDFLKSNGSMEQDECEPEEEQN